MTLLASDALPTDVLAQDTGAAPGVDPTQAPGAGGVDAQVAADKAAAAAAAAAAPDTSAVTTTTTNYSGGLPTSSDSIAQKILTGAEHYLGTPYVWGGTGPGGVDCSGLVMAAYKAAGINLPRISFQQANAGVNVGRDLSKLRPGDLIAWDNSSRNPGADHIAIYLGGGRIIEAAAPGTTVHIRTLGSNESYWGVKMGWQ